MIHVVHGTSFISSSESTTTSASPLSTPSKIDGQAREVRLVQKTRVVQQNWPYPVWPETRSLSFRFVGGPGMRVFFVEFWVRQESEEDEDIADVVHCWVP